MMNLGRVRPGATVYFVFETFAGSTGAPVTMSGFATSDIQVYKNGGTTQRASASGYTLLDTDGIDFDSVTGIHGFSIDLSDNTTAGFWEAGARYNVVVSTITVDSQTMSFQAGWFVIGVEGAVRDTSIASLSSQTSFTLTTGPADNSALVGCRVYIHDQASAVQCCFGLISAYTGASKTVTLQADPGIFTIAAGDNISILAPDYVAGYITAQTPLQPTTQGRTLDVTATGEAGVDWANVGSPTTTVNLSGTTVKTATDVETDTQDIQGRIPAALVGGRIDANVGAISSDATAADNAEAFFDGTGYAGTGNVIPTVTTVTNAVSANVTQISGDTTAADNAEAFFDGTGYAGTNNVIPLVTTTTTVTNAVSANVTQISGDTTAADNLEAALDGTGGVTITAGLTGNVTGNLSGSVGSVTGAVGSVTGAVGSVTGAVGSVAGAVGSVTGNVGGNVVGSVASVTAGVTVSTNNDKTGYRLSATGVDDVWDEAQSGHTTAGTFGKYLDDEISQVSGGGGGGGSSAEDIWEALVADYSGTVGSFAEAIQNLLNAVKAIANKQATAPAFIGGTFNPATDALEAIRDRGDAAWYGITGNDLQYLRWALTMLLGVGGETATPGRDEFTSPLIAGTLRMIHSSDRNDRVSSTEV